jgi:predicted Zn-dependent peptidase
MFTVGCQTKSESTLQAISAMTAELKKIRESEVTQEELKLAKESFMNSFVFNFDTEGEIVSRILTYEYYGYPADFLMKMRDQIEKVTAADILRAARTHIHPDKLQILVVGNPNEFDKPLSILGQVRTIDTTIPAPKQ